MNHRRSVSLVLFLLGAGQALPALRAQVGDPMREIQEIARQVDEQLQEIDRLLLESGRRDQPRQKPKQLLQQAHERSEAVEQDINKLIDKLNELKQQGGNSSSQDQQDQQQQDQQDQGQQHKPQGGQRNRRENQTSEFTQRRQPGEQQQPQPGEGQQPDQPQPSGQPNGGQENPDGGQNTRGNQQLEPELAPGQPGTGDGSWGELQPYVNFLKNRGSMPKVPEKYRKYWEAYLKQKQASGGRGSGR